MLENSPAHVFVRRPIVPRATYWVRRNKKFLNLRPQTRI